MPICWRMFLAVSRLGELAASRRVYCRAMCSDTDNGVKRMKAKKAVTMLSNTALMPSMIANSFENMEGLHGHFQACSLTVASNEEVASAAHRTDKSRMFRIVPQFLA